MSFSKHKLILQAYRISDFLAFLVAGVLAAWVSGIYTQSFDLYDILAARFSLANLIGYFSLALIWLIVFDWMHLYSESKIRTWQTEEVAVVGWATGIATLLYFVMGYAFEISLFSLAFLFSFWVISTAATLLFRRVMRMVLQRIHLGDQNNTRIMVIGTGDDARDYVKKIRRNRRLGFSFVGYIADECSPGVRKADYLGTLESFEQILKDKVIDEIVVTMPFHDFTEEVEHVIEHASAYGIRVRLPLGPLFSDLFGDHVVRLKTEATPQSANGIGTDLVLTSGFQLGWEYIAKRVFDFFAALIGIIVLSPLLIVIAVWIKMSSKGDVMFIQERYGYNGRIFGVYKFRTMIQNADELQEALRKQNEREGAAFKIKNDPRVTSAGKFLRKTSLDELPQLFNVLKGEMSLVGPRPLPLADYKRFQEVSHMRRLSVLPGITCTWQAGGRDNISFDQWMQLDMDYIDNWSFWGDFVILLKTVPAVLLSRGAS
ncbi:MAG: sugar transferase [Pontibacterium sp.]